jgi:Domain of Unknown Function (DUF748)
MESLADKSQTALAARPWWRRHIVAIGVVVALLLLYTLGGFLLVPYIARSKAIAYVQNDLHRQLTIGDLKFNPFTLALEIHDLNLAEADNSAIASFAMLHVEFNAMASIVHGAWTLADIKLDTPSVNVIINKDESLNLEKLVPPSNEPPPPPKPNASLPRVRVGLFSMHQGKVHFEDRSRDDQPFTATLTPIEFDLNDFRTRGDFENHYQFTAASLAGERFDWSGQFALRPLASSGEFSVTALKATTIASYLEDSLPCALNAGTLDIKGLYQFAAQNGAAPAISVTLPSVQLHQLAIAPKDAPASDTPWVSLPELDINDTRVVLNDRSASIGEIILQKPALQVWRDSDGTINLMKLAGPTRTAASVDAATTATAPATDARVAPVGEPPPSATPAPAAPGSAAVAKGPPPPPWKVTLAKFAIQEADIAAEDRSVKPTMKMHVAPLNVTVQNITSEGTKPLSYELDTALNDSGHLHTAGNVTLTPMAAQLGLELKSLDLSNFQPYVTPQSQLSVTRGDAGTDLKIEYADKPVKGKPQLLVTGTAQVMNVATRDDVTKADFVNWKALELSGINYQMNPTAVALDRIHLVGLVTRVAVAANGTINIKDVTTAPGAAPPPAAASEVQSAPVKPKKAAGKRAAADAPGKTVSIAPAKASPPPMPIRIKRIDIEQSMLNFSDRSIEPNFSAGILNLHGSVVGLSSAANARARINLDGQVDQFSPVQIRGETTAFVPMGYTDVSLAFHNMELTTFNPYSGKYAGYAIQQGKLSTDLHYHIDQRKLDATHHIVIDQLEFGQATESKQAVPLPIKLAVAILKDRNGVITLDLPEISGTIDDPKFKIGPLIWTFVKDLLVKVITAPFAALGNLFGGGPEMQFVEFPIGAAVLPDSETDKLNKLSKALVERPKLKLDVPLQALVPADDDALARASLEQAVTDTANGKKKSAKPVSGDNADPSARLKALTALYRQKNDKDPDFPQEDKSKKSAERDADRTTFLEQQLLAQFKPTQDQRRELGKARATAVQTAILANKELEAERVFLTEEKSGGNEDGKVKMEMKLE